MAIFGSKKNTKTEKKMDTPAAPKGPSSRDITHVIVRPRITEKASMLAEKNVYAFEVARNANKRSVTEAIRELYNVTPVEVRIVAIPSKKIIVRGKEGVKKGSKKAYVVLKSGETIEFV